MQCTYLPSGIIKISSYLITQWLKMSHANRCDDTFLADECQFFLPPLETRRHNAEGGWSPARLWPVCQLSLKICRSGHCFIPLLSCINHCCSLLQHLGLVLQHHLLKNQSEVSYSSFEHKKKKKKSRGWPWNWCPMLQVHKLAVVEHLEKKSVWLSPSLWTMSHVPVIMPIRAK